MKIEIDKPVVPKWFDDWYRTFEGNKANALYFLNRTGWGHDLTDNNNVEVEDYAGKLHILSDSYGYGDAQEYLSKAILFGYEVEKEPLYYAKIKGWKLIKREVDEVYWNLGDGDLFVSDNGELVTGGHHTKLTKQQWNKLGINENNADFEKVEQ